MKPLCYNQIMAKTSTDARRHIREWSSFFADSMAFSEELVNEFLKKYKKRKHLKQSLRRLIKRGFIKEEKGKLIVTKSGFKFFNPAAGKYIDKKEWDGKWYLLSFDIPIKLNVKRDRLRRVLRAYNFYPLQKSVWVGPNKFGEDIWKFLVNEEIDEYCKIMIVDVIEGDEEIRKHFRLG